MLVVEILETRDSVYPGFFPIFKSFFIFKLKNIRSI